RSCLGCRYHRLLSLLGTLTFFPEVPCYVPYSFWQSRVAVCRVAVILLAERLVSGRLGSFWVLGLGLLLVVWPKPAVRFSPLVFAFEMVGSSIYTVTSILTQRELDLHCATYNIPTELRPELPDRNSTIKDNSKGKIGMYTRFIELANYRIPLSKFLLCLLEYYQINLSQLSVIGAAKVSHFEIMCRAFGRIPTVDASVCPLSISWFGGTSVAKDPLPVDEAVDLPCVELLNENYTFIRKYPETFLCLVGLSRSFVKNDARPTLLHDNDEEMGLLDFVKSDDPFKVKVGERTLAEDKVMLITETKDRVISHSPQTISLVDHTIQDELNVNSGKRKKMVAFVSGEPPVKKARTEGRMLLLLLLLLQRGMLLRMHPPSGRFVVLSSSSANTDIPVASQVVPLVSPSQAGASVPAAESAGDSYPLPAPEHETGTLSATPSHDSSADDFYESQTIDSATAMNVYVPNWNVTNNARVNDPVICCNFLDHVTPPDYWAALRNQGDVGRVSDLEAAISLNIDEAASLTTQNIGLLEKVSALELERDSLKNQVVGEGKMREEFMSLQDVAERRFTERATELDASIADVRHDMDNDLYPHMLTAIAGRRWVAGYGFRLDVYKCTRSIKCRSAMGKAISMAINKGIQQGLEARIVHGKAGRYLAQIEAYDPEVEEKYVVAVSEVESVSFPLLDDLESPKDSPLASIMSALILKDDQGNTDAAPEFARFQPSLNQVVVPIYSESGSVDREMLLSDAILAVRQFAEKRG
ncbi:hypothetical protein Tco_1366618, partial [Tanacetum coccineum]